MSEELTVYEGEIVNAPLTEDERRKHIQYTQLIKDNFNVIGMKTLENWAALRWIRDNRTFRENYDTFDEFCRTELHKDNSQIYRLLKDAELKEKLINAAADNAEVASILALRESSTRPLRALPAEIQTDVWKLTYSLASDLHADGDVVKMTAGFVQAVTNRLDELNKLGGVHLDGTFIEASDGDTTEILLKAGVTEDAYEAIQRQAEHIKERSKNKERLTLSGTLRYELDRDGKISYVVEDKFGHYDNVETLLSPYIDQHVSVSVVADVL